MSTSRVRDDNQNSGFIRFSSRVREARRFSDLIDHLISRGREVRSLSDLIQQKTRA